MGNVIEEAFSMIPGRELDKLIAEKVMGWKWDDKTAWSPNGSRNSRTDRPDDLWWWLPHYSTDIGDAWQVVEKLRELGWYLAIHSDPKRGYFATIPRADGIQIESDTAPHAICLAALQASSIT